MNPKFKIETITTDGPHGYVRASIVTPQNFAVSAGSRLVASAYVQTFTNRVPEYFFSVLKIRLTAAV